MTNQIQDETKEQELLIDETDETDDGIDFEPLDVFDDSDDVEMFMDDEEMENDAYIILESMDDRLTSLENMFKSLVNQIGMILDAIQIAPNYVESGIADLHKTVKAQETLLTVMLKSQKMNPDLVKQIINHPAWSERDQAYKDFLSKTDKMSALNKKRG